MKKAAEERDRKPHATMDVLSRNRKGQKIEMLLDIKPSGQKIRVLDIGTGSGGIASYFGTHEQLRCEVISVDVVDERQVFDGYHFQKISGVELPFEDKSFDIVISNHVIEHVGLAQNQCTHLQELARVLKVDGKGYLAVPNRWMVIEPHYRLVFLSWLPRALRSPYLQLMGRGDFYDCEPLTVGYLEEMFERVGVPCRHMHIESIRALMRTESVPLWINFLARQPDFLLNLLRRLTPTLIYTFGQPSRLLQLK